MTNRRTFLAAGAATAASAAASKPVRETPLRARYFGPLFYDDKERQEVIELTQNAWQAFVQMVEANVPATPLARQEAAAFLSEMTSGQHRADGR